MVHGAMNDRGVPRQLGVCRAVMQTDAVLPCRGHGTTPTSCVQFRQPSDLTRDALLTTRKSPSVCSACSARGCGFDPASTQPYVSVDMTLICPWIKSPVQNHDEYVGVAPRCEILYM